MRNWLLQEHATIKQRDDQRCSASRKVDKGRLTARLSAVRRSGKARLLGNNEGRDPAIC
jgi:hypothetical protein